MTSYAVSLTDSKTGAQAYLGRTPEERFNESYIAFEAETLAEIAKWVLANVRGCKRYTEAGEWREVPRRFVRVNLFAVYGRGQMNTYPDVIIMGDLPEWITKHA
jgi:hypothetical protein